MTERCHPLSIFEENNTDLLDNFRLADRSAKVRHFYADVLKNAVKMHDPELVDSLLDLQLKKPEERYARFTSDKKLDLPDVVETIALTLSDPKEQKKEIVIAKFTGRNIDISDHYSYENLQVYNQNRVRDVYLLMGLANKIDFIPEIPQKDWRGRRRTETRDFYKEAYGLSLGFSFHSAQKPKIGEENQAHVVLKAGLHWPSH